MMTCSLGYLGNQSFWIRQNWAKRVKGAKGAKGAEWG